jgi:hypothetical protein
VDADFKEIRTIPPCRENNPEILWDKLPPLTISGSILGNDQILCGNIASRYYVVKPMKDSVQRIVEGYEELQRLRSELSQADEILKTTT